MKLKPETLQITNTCQNVSFMFPASYCRLDTERTKIYAPQYKVYSKFNNMHGSHGC